MLSFRTNCTRCYWVILFLLLLTHVFPNKCKGQDYVYREKILNILPNNFNREINCIAIDKHGFIWAGTNNGLFRYDGYNVDPIDFYNKNSFSISPEINDICYSNNHIYLATTEGLFIVETGSEKYLSHSLPELNRESIINVYPDDESGIWCITASGGVGNLNQSTLKMLQLNRQVQPNQVLITNNKQSIFLSFKDNQLITINKKQRTIENTWTFKQLTAITGIVRNTNNEILLCSNKGVFSLNNTTISTPTLIPRKEYGDSVSSIFYADKHVFVNRFNSSTDHIYISNGQSVTKKVITNKDNNLFTGRLSIKWYHNQLIIPGRLGLGIFQINKKYFNTIVQVTNTTNGDTRGIAEDDNYYYLCTYKNIFRYNKNTEQVQTISNEQLVTHGVYREADTLWIASDGNGLIRFNTKTFKADKLFANQPDSLRSMVCVKPLNRDNLILGCFKKIILYNKASKKITVIKPKNALNQELSNGYYKDIHIIDQNTLLVATPNGIFKINLDGRLINKFGTEFENTNPENTNCIWINQKKQVWTGTSNGVVIYDSNGKFLTRIAYQNGLAGNKVACMQPDNLGNLWVGTYTGLSSVSTSDLAIRNYYTEDGLPDNEFNHSSFYLDKNGKIIMGTMQGFVNFNPQLMIEEQNRASTILISKIERENKGIIEQSLVTNQKTLGVLQLGKGIKYLKIYFCRLPIQFFSEINFSYKILKLIPQNVDISDKPMITLTDTETGKFDIEVSINDGKGTNGIYNKIINYQSSEYFYVNKWFYLVIVFFFLLLAIGYLYTLIIQKNNNINIRNEIARDLHDEIGGSLTAISLYSELLRPDKPPTIKQIDSIQTTTRKLLLSFRDALWTLNTESDSALQLWDHIKDMVSEIAGNLNINVTYEDIYNLDNIKLTLATKRNLLLVLKEGINNAIKHGDHNFLILKWVIENEKHAIIIVNSINNSITESKFTISNGIGLNSMQKRMHDVGGDVSYQIENQQFQIKYHLNFIK